jgi:phosphohistidine phosphatase
MGLRKWGIPKGMIDPGDTLEQTALKEAWEEAGIKGRLMEAIGTYDHCKWGSTYVVTVYLMEILEQDEDWPEAGFRERRWTSFEEAALMLADHPVHPLLARARQLITGTLGWPIDIPGR